jgi:xanthine dehydrogenase YagS FAD-binding subunit
MSAAESTARRSGELAELRAGGTDLGERRRSGVARGPIVDIERRIELTRVEWRTDAGANIGALVTIADVASDPKLAVGYPGLAAAAARLATPQIRRVGTIGGNLLQRTRCWYYRHPATSCLKKGGTDCPARAGNHRYGVLFDLGPCVAPHPSTLGMAFLAYDATVMTSHRAGLPMADLFGDGSDGTNDHQLVHGELLTTVSLPPPTPNERAAYFRAVGRVHAEWPLAETVVRIVVEDGTVTMAAIAVGGVAPVPLRLAGVESALLGMPATPSSFAKASALAAVGANPPPLTAYKATVLVGTVAEALERARSHRPDEQSTAAPG